MSRLKLKRGDKVEVRFAESWYPAEVVSRKAGAVEVQIEGVAPGRVHVSKREVDELLRRPKGE